MQSEKAKAHEVWDCVAEHSRISKTNLNFQRFSPGLEYTIVSVQLEFTQLLHSGCNDWGKIRGEGGWRIYGTAAAEGNK